MYLYAAHLCVWKCCVLTELISAPAQAVFARGISAVSENYICVGKYGVEYIFPFIWQNCAEWLSFSSGVSSGAVLVFDVPSKGSNITLSEVLEEHQDSITDMASECSGNQVWCMCVWSANMDKLLPYKWYYLQGTTDILYITCSFILCCCLCPCRSV